MGFKRRGYSKKLAEKIDGIIVTLPNFGEERGIVDVIRLSGLKVPVLVQVTPDRADAMTIATRGDSLRLNIENWRISRFSA